MDEKIRLIAVCGPTASGKTAVAAMLGKKLGGEVISADSMQIYKYMDIGTAKPAGEETLGVPHHLIGFLEPDEDFSVADYVRLAGEKVSEIAQRGRIPIVAGGTGLYISSLVSGISYTEMKRDPAVRAELEALTKEKGGEYMLSLLADIDPALARILHPNDAGRIIRAIEAYRLTGIPMSELQRRSRENPLKYEALMIGLCFSDRQKLYERINARVDAMLASGLEAEARGLHGRFSKTAAQAIGYKEFAPYFAGEITLEDVAEKIRMETRRYAKRQLTWFRRDKSMRWFEMDESGAIEGIITLARKFMAEGREAIR